MDERISSNPILRAAVVVVPGIIFAIFLGSQLGQGDLLGPLIFVGATAVLCGLVLFPYIIPEAWVLSFLLAGYIVSQMAFGHFSVSQRFPLFFGELGLVISVAVLLVRTAFTRAAPIPRHPVAYAVCIFIAVGTVRLWFDIQTTSSSLNAIRDYATIYYAVFFFIAFQVCKFPRSRRFVERVMMIALIVLTFAYLGFYLVPSVYDHIYIHGFPLVAFRSDLTGSFMGFAAIWFYLRGRHSRATVRWTLLSALCVCVGLLALSRAVFVAFAAGALLLVIARKAPIVGIAIVMSAVAGLAILVGQLGHASEYNPSMAGEEFGSVFRDKLVSLADPLSSGKQQYNGDAGEWSAGNNRFREHWWSTVFHETMSNAPLTGLGFGYDLSRSFLRTYDAPMTENTGRSPHSIVFTVIGRMGLIGLCALLYLVWAVSRSAFRCARGIARNRIPAEQLAPWAGVVIILITSCFGVMLEGPMAAVVFWSLLGVATYDETTRVQQSLPAAVSPAIPRLPATRLAAARQLAR